VKYAANSYFEMHSCGRCCHRTTRHGIKIPLNPFPSSGIFKNKIHRNLLHYEWYGDNTDHRWEDLFFITWILQGGLGVSGAICPTPEVLAKLFVKAKSAIFAMKNIPCMGKLEKIQNEILSLSVEERELIGIFLKEKQYTIGPDYTQAWQSELEKRMDDVRNGKANLVSSEFAVSEIRKKIAG
jgi:hypothetical protein